MKTLLYLDDKRNPLEQTHVDISYYDRVVHVKNYNEFIEYILNNKLPTAISFDHDLHKEHYAPIEHWTGTYRIWREQNKFTKMTGTDCANFLVNYCLQKGINLPIWGIHSSNPIGAMEITKVLVDYAEYYYHKNK